MYVPVSFHLPPIEVAISSLKFLSESGSICATCAKFPLGEITCIIIGPAAADSTDPDTVIVSPAAYDSLSVETTSPFSAAKASTAKNGLSNNTEKARSQNLLNCTIYSN